MSRQIAVFFLPTNLLTHPNALTQSPLCLGHLSRNDELCMTKQAFKFILYSSFIELHA